MLLAVLLCSPMKASINDRYFGHWQWPFVGKLAKKSLKITWININLLNYNSKTCASNAHSTGSVRLKLREEWEKDGEDDHPSDESVRKVCNGMLSISQLRRWCDARCKALWHTIYRPQGTAIRVSLMRLLRKWVIVNRYTVHAFCKDLSPSFSTSALTSHHNHLITAILFLEQVEDNHKQLREKMKMKCTTFRWKMSANAYALAEHTQTH